MFIVNSYALAVIFCFITMICWGSWGNTQKLAGKTWRYELFYWDYTIGILLFSILLVFTMGSFGSGGRSFIEDISQVEWKNILSAIVGGIIFNASNILLSASTSIAGLSVAFPLGVGLALVLGVFINYFSAPKGDPVLLFVGVALIVIAIICNGIASGKNKKDSAADKANNRKGTTPGMATPYTAFFLLAVGVFLSNFIFNTIVMRKPFVGEPVSYKEYFAGKFSTHLTGILGGCIWGLGTALSYIAAGKAGAAISYALGQGAPMIAALWGVFIWKEFAGCTKSTKQLLAVMFVFFIAGLSLIVVSGGN